MKGQQPLSPRKYIETRARLLPIDKCYVNIGWEEAHLAEVIVTRRHINSHLTAGIFLVDLLCLGIKDTFFVFNEEEEEVAEKLSLDSGIWQEIDYNLAHNIIYAGHDFALDYDIHPDKGFQTTKYLLEEDSDAIPIIEIATGDKNGKPHLLVAAGYPYKAVLDKLQKNAGEGNYTFSIRADHLADLDDDWDDEDEWQQEWDLDKIEPDFLDFLHVKNVSGEKLEEAFESEGRSGLDKTIITIEMVLRSLSEYDPDWDKTKDEIAETEDFQAFENAVDKAGGNENRLVQAVKKADAIFGMDKENSEWENEDEAFLYSKFEENIHDEMLAFLFLNMLPPSAVEDRWGAIQQQFPSYPPLVQLAVASVGLALTLDGSEMLANTILKHSDLEKAFPGHDIFPSLHYKYFWLAKAIAAIQQNDIKQIQHYHSLLSVAEIPPGQVKLVYAVTFSLWLGEMLNKQASTEN